MATLKLFVDTQNKRLVDNFTSKATYTLPSFYVGDSNINLELHLLQPSVTDDISQPFDYVSPTGSTFEVAIGDVDQAPDGGTFTLTDPDNAETTAAIDYDSSAATVQAAIRAGLSTAYGSATVTGDAGGPWTIDRVTTGSVTSLSGSGTNLTPDSFVGVNTLRTGTASLSYRTRIRLVQQPAAYVSPSTALPSAAVTVTTQTAGSATANEVQRVAINSDTYDGTFTLTSTTLGAANNETKTSSPIPFNATGDELKTILDASFGTDNTVTVTEVNDYTWDVEFTGSNVDLVDMAAMTGDATGLSVPVGVSGTLNLNTTTALGLIGTSSSKSTKFEVQQTTSGAYTTLYQAGVTLVNDLIDEATAGATDLPSFYTQSEINDFFADPGSNTNLDDSDWRDALNVDQKPEDDIRVATMSGDETLSSSGSTYQFLDPNGSDRNLDLPDDNAFTVKNTGDGGETITVRDSSDSSIDTIDNGVTLTFIYDGSDWQVIG